MTELQRLREWIASHPDVLADKTVDEIADLAVAAGFDRSAVAMWQCSEKFKRAG